jgi:hypothetical protein
MKKETAVTNFAAGRIKLFHLYLTKQYESADRFEWLGVKNGCTDFLKLIMPGDRKYVHSIEDQEIQIKDVMHVLGANLTNDVVEVRKKKIRLLAEKREKMNRI